MLASKMLTGKDMPMMNIEMTLTNTFHIATKRFEEQQRKAQRGNSRGR